MNYRTSSFSAEMEKISASKIPATVLFGAGGAALGAKSGFKNYQRDQRWDEARFRRGIISKKERDRRTALRLVQGLGGATVGGATGAYVPIGVKRLSAYLTQVAKDASKPLADELESSGRKVVDYARREASDLMAKDSVRSAKAVRREFEEGGKEMGRRAGEGFAEALHDVSVDHGKAPAIHLRHSWPWSRKG